MTNTLFKQFYLRDLYNVINMLIHNLHLQVAACLCIVLKEMILFYCIQKKLEDVHFAFLIN